MAGVWRNGAGLAGFRVLRIAGIEWQGPKIDMAAGLDLKISQAPAVGGKSARHDRVLALQQHLYFTRAIRTNPIQP